MQDHEHSHKKLLQLLNATIVEHSHVMKSGMIQ